MAEAWVTVGQYGFGGAVAAAMIALHWMTLRSFALENAKERELQRAEAAAERASHREQLVSERLSYKQIWEQFLTLKLQHHSEVMAVLSQHGQVLAELRTLTMGGRLGPSGQGVLSGPCVTAQREGK